MIKIKSGFNGDVYPVDTPRICAFPISGTVVASSETTGFEGVNAADGLTWTAWKASAASATWTLGFTSQAVNYVGIAAHNIGSTGATVYVRTWNGSAWVTKDVLTPTDDSPILFLFPVVTLDQIRVFVDNGPCAVGVIMVGNSLEFPLRAQFTGSAPFDEAVRDQYADTISDGGHVLERFVTRKSVPAMMTVIGLSETWCTTNLPALQDYLAESPAFFADRPQDSLKSVAFGMLAEPFAAARSRSVAGAARDVSFKINGFAA